MAASLQHCSQEDRHEKEQGVLLRQYYLNTARAGAKTDELWSADGPKSISPFVPCAASRIPLVLRFFCGGDAASAGANAAGSASSSGGAHNRLKAMADRSIQDVITSVMFDFGEWSSLENSNDVAMKIRSPKDISVPLLDRHAFATACGLLFKELHHSPTLLLESLTEMARLVFRLTSDTTTTRAGFAM